MSGGPLRVLLVDDDEAALEALSSVLSCAGCELVSLASPIGSTRVAIERAVDVIVLDLHMSAFSGDRLAAILRKSRQLSEVPIIVVLPTNGREDPMTQRAAGVVPVPEAGVLRNIVHLVQELVASRPRRISERVGKARSLSGSGPSFDSEVEPVTTELKLVGEGRDMIPRLLRLSKVWRDASLGNMPAQRVFSALLSDISTEYGRTEGSMFSDICVAIEGTQRTLKPGAHASASMSGAILAGVNLMVRLSRTKSYERPAEVSAVLWRLAQEISKTLDEPLLDDDQQTALRNNLQPALRRAS